MWALKKDQKYVFILPLFAKARPVCLLNKETVISFGQIILMNFIYIWIKEILVSLFDLVSAPPSVQYMSC